MVSASAYFPAVAIKLATAQKKASVNMIADMAVKADQYVPEDTGATRIGMKVDLKNMFVEWKNEYVEYIYWGLALNFQKTHNPKAQAMWADKATEENIDDWEKQYADILEGCF